MTDLEKAIAIIERMFAQGAITQQDRDAFTLKAYRTSVGLP